MTMTCDPFLSQLFLSALDVHALLEEDRLVASRQDALVSGRVLEGRVTYG
jgi:hypothetical protein